MVWMLIFNKGAVADVLYVGDNTFSNVAKEINKRENINIAFGVLENESVRVAGIWNYQDWLYTTKQEIDAHNVDVVVISLGKKDLRLSNRKFPSEEELDFGISEILSSVDVSAPIYWILPHSFMPKKQSQKDKRQIVTDAILRAYNSQVWPNLYLVSLDDWSVTYDVKMIDLLATNRTKFSSEGAAEVAGLLVLHINNSVSVGQL